jgi:3-hydroxyisobutyrate dehydrogenase
MLAGEVADLAETPAEAVREAAFVITMLTDTAAVLARWARRRSRSHTAPSGSRPAWTQTWTASRRSRRTTGITFVSCPVIGTRKTASRGRLVVLASGPGDVLDRAQPVLDAIGSKTVRLEPETGRASRMRLVVSAWTVGILESLRAQLSRGGL